MLKSVITNIFQRSSIAEIYTISILLILLLLNVVFFASINRAELLLSLNIIALIALYYYPVLFSRFSRLEGYEFYRMFFLAPIAYGIFVYTHYIVPAVNPNDIDTILIAIDKWLFWGNNPLDFLYVISSPLLTEILQICYTSFFILPLFVGGELSIKGRYVDILGFARIMIFGFFLSFLLYFPFPAIGPRFTIYDFANLSNELPGLLLTEPFRLFVNTGGGIPLGHHSPAEVVNRDCFPSGHTMMTVMLIFLAFKLRVKIRYFIAIIGFGLIFGTIYLRYHYVIDVFAGIFFAFIALKIEPKIELWLLKIRQKV